MRQDPSPLSPSQVNDWADCPAKAYYRHQLHLPEITTPQLANGRAIHRGVTAAIGAILAHAAPEDLATDLAAIAHEESADPATVQTLITLYQPELAKLDQPRSEIKLAGQIAGIRVHAVADLITPDLVIDVKTTARRPGYITARNTLQLTTYAILARVDRARLDVLAATKTPTYTPYTLEIDAAARRYAETMYAHTADAITAGLVTPRRDSLMCTRAYCSFWPHCQIDFGGHVRSAKSE
jgi:CRISPR/Cas system-associated exonuclease Cas4 (RecB family)